ncbi:MAG TPA: AMP-binding protein [Gemmatimonadota bacterium]|nr:AMP-binding protein [Gemmatimonadota bacterium]
MDRITGFLTGKRILLTGATGFLGQPLVEKILWAAPDVERIHVLIRPKRQFGGDVLSATERLEGELFQSSVFDRLRFRHGDDLAEFLASKVEAVAGDISHPGLGLDPAVAERLQAELDVVINSAAVVSFDAPLDQALELNTRGAARMADFAAGCDHAILIHVSTAYVCGATDAAVPETLHHTASPGAVEPPLRQFVDPEAEIAQLEGLVDEVRAEGASGRVRRELVQAMVERRARRGAGKQPPRREAIEALKDKWMERRLIEVGMERARARGWNDTYTYTKALGEQMVMARSGAVPVAIVRPAIIESSLHEPSPGWLDGLRMADPLIVAIGKGRLRSLPLDPDVVLDLVPADMVVNAMLAAIPKLAEDGGPAIYQVATGSRNPVRMKDLHELIVLYFQANPMLDKEGRPIRVKALRFPGARRFRAEFKARAKPLEWAEKALDRLQDAGLTSGAIQKQKRKVSASRAAIEKLFYYGELYEPYLNLDCRFLVDNTMRLYEWLTPEERRRFDFDVSRLNWRHYMHVHIAGVKKYILKLERAGTLEVGENAAAEEAAIGSIWELLERGAERWPDKILARIRRGDEWHEITFAEMRAGAWAAGERLLRLGLSKGDRVVLVSENMPEWGVCYMGAASIGLVVVPLDAQTWHREVWATADFTGARAILASRACFERWTDEERAANEAAGEPVLLLEVEAHGRPFDRPEWPRSTRPAERSDYGDTPEVGRDDLASIIFTTGTAVDPRGAMHTHGNFLENLFGMNRYHTITDQDEFLSVLPLYHALEFTGGFLSPVYSGATVTYTRSLKPKTLIETMRDTGTTVMLGVPTLYALIRDDIHRRILRSSGKSPVRSNLMQTTRQLSRSWQRAIGRNLGRQLFPRVHEEMGGRIRFFVSGGSALGGELFDEYRALGIPIYEGYGLTETAPTLTVNPLYQGRRGSCGKPLPGIELRLYHTNREGVGEIIVRTPSLMRGYWDNSEATDRVVVDGWFHTGDLGWVDADGYLYITGRIKDVIVTGAGKNVYPIDLEAIYRELPEIEDVCVVGVKSGLTEDVHAAVVPAASLCGDDPEAALKAIRSAAQGLAKELPSYHRLQQVHVWAEPLPRRPDGELDRVEVRRAVERRLQEGRDPTPAPPAVPAGADPEAVLLAELARLTRRPPEEIERVSHLYDDLGLDSLQAIELLLFLDHRMGISLDDQTAESIRTVGHLFDEVDRRRGDGRPAIPSETAPIRSARPFGDRSPIDRALLAGFGSGTRALYDRWFDLDVVHPEWVPESPPYVVAANHASHLDTPAVLAAVAEARGNAAARALHALGARDYFFDTPLKGWFFSTFLNVVPIEREEASLAGLRMVRRILEGGESVLIFPEGTRSRSGEVQPFKPGLGLIAWEIGVPVVPARISGTFEALPAGRSVPRRQRLTVTFGEPVLMDAYREDSDGRPRDELYRRIASDVRAAIVGLGEDAESETARSR